MPCACSCSASARMRARMGLSSASSSSAATACTAASNICMAPGKASRKKPEMRSVTSTRGRPMPTRGTTSKSTMRTGGDDIAQAFALIGVRPKWAPGSQRVVDFEVVPRVGMGRPRVDVTLRISGFFRDAFPGAMQMFDAAVQAVAALDEDAEDNPIRARILAEAEQLQAQGMDAVQARLQAGWRVFGAPPGHYGSGLGDRKSTRLNSSH